MADCEPNGGSLVESGSMTKQIATSDDEAQTQALLLLEKMKRLLKALCP